MIRDRGNKRVNKDSKMRKKQEWVKGTCDLSVRE